MEESDLVNLCWQNSLNPVTREEISCLVWCDIKNFSGFFTEIPLLLVSQQYLENQMMETVVQNHINFPYQTQ
jgi:hypothetical protein